MKKIAAAFWAALAIGAAGCSASPAGNAGAVAAQASTPCSQGAGPGAPAAGGGPATDGQASSCLSSRSTAGEPPIGSIPTVTSGLLPQLPLDRYELSIPQLEQVLSAHNLAAHACLRQLGIDVSEHVFSSPNMNISRYQLHDLPLSQAQTNAYAPVDAGVTPTGGYSGGSAVATPDALAAFSGTKTQINGKPVPKGGCNAWGLAAINSPSVSPDPLTYIYDAEASTLSDARMLQVFAKWSTCMSGKGFSGYQAPTQAQSGTPTGNDWPPAPSQAEIATATADAECRVQGNVQGMWVALMTAYENQEISKDLPTLIHDHQVTQEWLTHAAAFGA